MPTLPHDIIDPIVEALTPVPWTEPKDYATLTTCSLVSHSFRKPSQRQLFRSLSVGGKAVPRLAKGLSSTPRLATYIHALHIIDVSFTHEDARAALAMLFPLLTQLTHLALSFPYIDMKWSACPPAFRSVVVNLLSSPALKCFTLRNCWGVPSSLVRHAFLLYEEVSLMNVGVAGEDGEEVFSLQKRATAAPLCRLSVRYTQMLYMAVPVHALILTAAGSQADSAGFSLRQFEMSTIDLTTPETFGKLEPLVASLEHLMLHFEYTRDPQFYDKHLPLPATPNLHIHTLTLSLKSFIATCVLRTLTLLPASLPNIVQINILLERPGREFFNNLSERVQSLSLYDQVDGVLTTLAGFCELHICLIQETQVRSQLPEFETRTRARLPLAHRAGKLRFSRRGTSISTRESPFFRPHLP